MASKSTKKDVYYFPHDYNPTSDPKMLAFVGEYGAIGYGIYWRIVEMLHESKEHTLPMKNYIYSAIAKQMLTDVEHVLKVVESCINDFELFDSNEEYFWCNRVLRNVEKRVELIAKKVKAGEASAEARKNKKNELKSSTDVQHNSTRVEQTLTHAQHNLTEGNKGKEIKSNQIILDNTKLNNQSNQYIYNNNINAEIQQKIDKFENICQKFLIDDLQNFVDYFKGLDIREKNIREALQDYKDNKLVGEVTSIPYTYSNFKEWFKKYISDNRTRYKHVPKMRIVSISDKVTRLDLHSAFKFYWQEEYTIEFIREKIMSGEFPIKAEGYCFDKLVKDHLIEIAND